MLVVAANRGSQPRSKLLLPQNIPFVEFKQLLPVLSQGNPVDVQAYVCGAHKGDGERTAAIDIIWNICKKSLKRGTVAKYPRA